MHAPRFLVLACALLGIALLPACHQVHLEIREGVGEIVIPDDLFSVTPIGENKVLAAGYWGSIYLSDDGGESWLKADTGTRKLIYDIAMADEQRGWAVGQVGLVMRTEDGGRTWTTQSTPKDDDQVHLFSIQALDANTAWAVGEWGTRIVTRDGGKTWEDRSLTIDQEHPQFVWLSIPDQERVRAGEPVFEDVGLVDIYCLPQKTDYCWIIGEFAYLFRTEDGGETWEKGQILSGTEVPTVDFGYNDITIEEPDFDRVREFASSIVDQQHLNIAIFPYASDREVREFGKSDDPFPLFDIIEARTQEIVAAVEDAGVNTDRIRRRNTPPWDYEDFIEDDPEFLTRYLEGRTAEESKVVVQIAQNPYLFTVRFADEQAGYISGLGGVVLRSDDGGRIWRYEDIGRKAAIFSVHPFDANDAVIVGEKGIARSTADGGKTWTQIEGFPEIFTFVRDVSFLPGKPLGYAVGQNGMVLRSDDAGVSWRQVFPKPESEATEVASH